MQGRDTTVGLADPEDIKIKDAIKVVEELDKLEAPLLVVSVPNDTTREISQYVITFPLASLRAPVGRWTRTSIGYDI